MTDVVTNAEYRAALGSIKYNASNFQVFTPWIALMILVGFTVLAGSFVAMQSNDNMSSGALTTTIIADALFLVILALAYLAYVRNVGRYATGRIKSSFVTPENVAKCAKEVGRYATGTSTIDALASLKTA